jgi:hypothetical protein
MEDNGKMRNNQEQVPTDDRKLVDRVVELTDGVTNGGLVWCVL